MLVATATIRVAATEGQIYGRQLQQAGDYTGRIGDPIVSIGFALRGDLGWLRVPGYLLAQFAGGLLVSMVLRLTFGDLAHLGATLPGAGFSAPAGLRHRSNP